jgi:hypothetical protein
MLTALSGILGFTRDINAVPLPNQVTSKTAFVPFTDAGANDWQGRYYTIQTAAGYWMAVWVEGTNHSDYNSASHYVNIHFSNDEGATWSDNNEYIGGAAITGFPLVPPGGSSTGFVDFTIIRCPNDDLVIIAQDRGSNPSVWNTVNFSQHQYRSTDDGQTWAYEFDYCNHIGFTTTAQKAKIQGLFENMVVGSTVYITHCEIRTDLDDTRISLYKSEDNCANWSLVSHPLEFDELSPDGTASAIAHLGNGRFICIFRTQDLGSGYMKTSDDSGLTWNAVEDFGAQLGYVGIHDPKVKSYSNFFLLYGRDCKKILNDPDSAFFMRNAWWTTTDLFETSAERHYLDPFYAGDGTLNGGDAGYVRAMQKSDGSFLFFGYYGDNFEALIYKYDVSHTAAPSTEHYSNIEFFPETITSNGIRLQLNRDNIRHSPSTPSVGIAILNRAHNTLNTGDKVWPPSGTTPIELVIQDDRGWGYFVDCALVSATTDPNLLLDGSFSVAFWLQPNDGNPAATNAIVWCNSAANTTLADGILISLTTAGKILARYAESAALYTGLTDAAVFADGTVAARHIAITFTSGDFIRIYIDGTLVTLDATSNGNMAAANMANFSSTRPIYLGARNISGASFDLPYIGKLREFIIQPVVWDATQIGNIMLN